MTTITNPETKPALRDLSYIPDCPGNMGDWKGRHLKAVKQGRLTWPTQYATVTGIAAWCEYAEAHAHRFDSPIGEDYVLGPAWRDWGLALRTLLNGELGPGVDAGTLDGIIVHNLTIMGYEGDL